MKENPRASFQPRTWWFIPGAIFVAAAITLTSIVLSDSWSRSRIDLVESFTQREPRPDWPYLNAEDRSAEVCAPPVNCVQAVSNEYLTLLKFARPGDARRYAEALGDDGHQIDPLVIHFHSRPLSAEKRTEIIAAVSGINSSSGD